MAFKDFLKKVQEQEEQTRKVILWGVTIAVGILLFAAWGFYTMNSLQNNEAPPLEDQLQLQLLQEQFENIPIDLNAR
jgi:hypothetical protein